MNNTSSTTPWFTRQEAAEYLRTSVGHLANLHMKELGPVARGRNGNRPIYHRDDLDAWLTGTEVAS